MRALFCHDHHYYRRGADVLSKGQYHHTVWQRYLEHLDELTVVGRDGRQISDDKNVNVASRSGISFELLPNTNTVLKKLFGRKPVRETIRLLVSDHDVVILRGISEIGMMAFAEAKRQGKPIVMEMVACAWDELWYHGSVLAKIYAPYRFIMTKKIARGVDAVLYVTQSFLQRRYPSDARIQAVASNVQLEQAAFSKMMKSCGDAFHIGLIGTLNNRLKGVHIAIQAAALLKQKNIGHFKIHILGPGDAMAAPCYFGAMAERYGVADFIVFDGIRTSGQPVWEWLRAMDLYIQPSFQEGVPRALIEAMAQSLPAIGSNAGGIPELLENDYTIQRGDASALVDKIEWLMKNPDIRRLQGEKNYDVATRYSADKLEPIRFQFWADVKQMVLQSQTRSIPNHPIQRS